MRILSKLSMSFFGIELRFGTFKSLDQNVRRNIFDLLYAFVIVRLDRRDLVWINVTATPTAEWVARQITEAFPWDEASRYLIRDRDRIYGRVVTCRVRAMGIRDKPTAPASPWQNGFVERLIGSIRRECVDHILVSGEAHLRRILKSPIAYRNEGGAYSLPPGPRRIASRICPDLISDRHRQVERVPDKLA